MRQNSPKREALNKKLALLCGWKRTENRNWEAPTGEIYALPPDYCRNKSKLASLVETSLTRKELESVATYILSLKVVE